MASPTNENDVNESVRSAMEFLHELPHQVHKAYEIHRGYFLHWASDSIPVKDCICIELERPEYADECLIGVTTRHPGTKVDWSKFCDDSSMLQGGYESADESWTCIPLSYYSDITPSSTFKIAVHNNDCQPHELRVQIIHVTMSNDNLEYVEFKTKKRLLYFFARSFGETDLRVLNKKEMDEWGDIGKYKLASNHYPTKRSNGLPTALIISPYWSVTIEMVAAADANDANIISEMGGLSLEQEDQYIEDEEYEPRSDSSSSGSDSSEGPTSPDGLGGGAVRQNGQGRRICTVCGDRVWEYRLLQCYHGYACLPCNQRVDADPGKCTQCQNNRNTQNTIDNQN